MKDENAENSDPLAGALAALEAESDETPEVVPEETPAEEAPTEETKEVPEEAAEVPKEEKEEDEDHSEKSRLGRKFKRLEDNQSTLTAKLDAILAKLTPEEAKEAEEEFELSEYPTAEELRAFKDFTVRKAKEAAVAAVNEVQSAGTVQAKKYETTYLQLMADMTTPDSDDDDVSDKIKELMLSQDERFNKTYSNHQDPTRDFLKNYRNATDFLLKKGTEKKPNVHGKPPSVPTGVNVPKTTQKVVSFDRSKLDPVEAALAKGFKDEELVSMGFR